MAHQVTSHYETFCDTAPRWFITQKSESITTCKFYTIQCLGVVQKLNW